MYWSHWDTSILVTGILTVVLSLIPFKVVPGNTRLGIFIAGAAIIGVSVITGNLQAFTYPPIVEAGPVFPIGVGVLFAVVQWRAGQQKADPLAGPPMVHQSPAEPIHPVDAPTQVQWQQPTEVASVSDLSTSVPALALTQPKPDLAHWAESADTEPEVLADLAYRNPELRPAIAANPAAYTGLLEWLAQFDDPELQSVLKRRALEG